MTPLKPFVAINDGNNICNKTTKMHVIQIKIHTKTHINKKTVGYYVCT